MPPTSIRTIEVPSEWGYGNVYALGRTEVLVYSDGNQLLRMDVVDETTDSIELPPFDGRPVQGGFDLDDGVAVWSALVCDGGDPRDRYCPPDESHIEMWGLDLESFEWEELGRFTVAELVGDDDYRPHALNFGATFATQPGEDESYRLHLSDEDEQFESMTFRVDLDAGTIAPFEDDGGPPSSGVNPPPPCELTSGGDARIDDTAEWTLQVRRDGDAEWTSVPDATRTTWLTCGDTTAWGFADDRWIGVDLAGQVISSTPMPELYAADRVSFGTAIIGRGTDQPVLLMTVARNLDGDERRLPDRVDVLVGPGVDGSAIQTSFENLATEGGGERGGVRLPGGRVVMLSHSDTVGLMLVIE